MAGYKGYSMSNNAVSAYESGERPMSKWTKADLLHAAAAVVEENELALSYDLNDLRVLPVSALRSALLVWSSWHHTSDRYNVTDFYRVSPEKLERLDAESIEALAAAAKELARVKRSQKGKETDGYRARCHFLEWTGSRKHPKAIDHVSAGTIRGNWFYPDDTDGKKSTKANGFYVIERL